MTAAGTVQAAVVSARAGRFRNAPFSVLHGARKTRRAALLDEKPFSSADSSPVTSGAGNSCASS